MRSAFLLAFSIIGALIPTGAVASRADSLKASANDSREGIGIFVIITPDRKVFEAWEKPQTPEITSSTSYKRGAHAIPLIIYTFSSDVQTPYPRLSYDIAILKPDSSVYGKFENLSVFDGRDVMPRGMYPVTQPLDIGLEERDPLGIYRINIAIYANGQQIMSFTDLAFEVTE